MLRIIAGTLRGIKIEEPNLDITRPTTDKVREAIFSSIQFEIPNSKILDLFSGSGAMSFEAISRGALEVDATEKDYRAYQKIKRQIQDFQINNFNIYNQLSREILEMKKGKKYDFIFMDPPYDKKDLVHEALDLIVKNQMLDEEGKIIIETNNEKDIKIPQELEVVKNKKYGKTFVLYLRWMEI